MSHRHMGSECEKAGQEMGGGAVIRRGSEEKGATEWSPGGCVVFGWDLEMGSPQAVEMGV